jgi:hypothetical protein
LPLAELAALAVLAFASATAERVVADGRRTPDRAAAADVTDPCAEQDRSVKSVR